MAKQITFSSQLDLLKALTSKDIREQNNGFDYIYRTIYGPFRQWVYKVNNGSEEEAKDAFQSGLLNFVLDLRAGKYLFQSNTKITTVIFLYSKRLYLNRINAAGVTKVQPLAEDFEEADTSYDIYKAVDLSFLKQAINKLGEKCRLIIQLFYLEAMPLEEIAEKLGIKNPSAAKQKRYECTKQLKEIFLDILK